MPRIEITDQYALVKRKGSARWYLEWRERGHKQRRSCGSSDIDAAKVRAREIILESATIRDQTPASMPLHVVLDRYMAQHGSKIARSTSARIGVELWKKFFSIHFSVADLRVERLEAFTEWLYERGASRGYVRSTLAVGKAALNRAWQRQEITSAPYVRLPTPGDAYPDFAKREQLVKFLNHVKPGSPVWMYCMIRLNTGCRDDAARDLQPFQVDFAANLVQLNPHGRAQTKKFRRVVPITRTLRATLKASESKAYYVVSHRRGKRLGCIRKAWGTICKAAGLVNFPPKILRHTFGTELRRRGVPGWEISGMQGHKGGHSHPTTETYAKFDPAYLGKARKAIDAWMTDLASSVPALRGVSPGSVVRKAKTAQPVKVRAAVGFPMVEPIGIEPMTSTMPLLQKAKNNNSKGARILPFATTNDQGVTETAGSVRGQSRKRGAR